MASCRGVKPKPYSSARGGAWRNSKLTGGPYVCEQCRLDACGGNDATLTIHTAIRYPAPLRGRSRPHLSLRERTPGGGISGRACRAERERLRKPPFPSRLIVPNWSSPSRVRFAASRPGLLRADPKDALLTRGKGGCGSASDFVSHLIAFDSYRWRCAQKDTAGWIFGPCLPGRKGTFRSYQPP